METDVFLELHVPDFDKAIEFYSKLGFRTVWRSEDYLVMRRGRSIINFYGDSKKVFKHSYFGRFPTKTKRGYAVEIIIMVENIKEFYKKIKRHAKVVEPLKFKRWERWDFRIEDPFGFYIRFTERYDWVNNLDKRQEKLVRTYEKKKKSR